MRLLCSCIQLTSSQELKHECSWATYVNRKWGHFRDSYDYSEVWAKALPKNSKCPLPVGVSCSKTPLLKLPILHFHISHNTPCLPPKHFAQGLSFISLGTTVMTSRYKKQKLCKSFVGANKVYCGGCASGELAGRYSGHYISPGSCMPLEDNTNAPIIV